MENIEADYEARPELDRYEDRGIDNQIIQNELSLDGRREVEERLEREERFRMAGRRPGAFIDDEYEEDQDEVMAAMKQERMRMMMRDNGGGDDDENLDGMDNVLDFEDVQGPLSVWLKKADVVKFIYRQFN
jgi:hypothetical protein